MQIGIVANAGQYTGLSGVGQFMGMMTIVGTVTSL